MSTEDNKAVAFRFFERFTANDIVGALDTMAEDATWWIPGKKDQSPSAGLYPKEKIGRLFNRMINALEDGLTMTARLVRSRRGSRCSRGCVFGRSEERPSVTGRSTTCF
jgi:ketosteroid isomerase-like protein